MTVSTPKVAGHERPRAREVLVRQARRISKRWELAQPALSAPFPAFVVDADDVAKWSRSVHAGWEAILFDGDTPRAVLSASRARSRRLALSGVTGGDWPGRLTAAVATAEANGLLRHNRFAVVTVPHAGLAFVWNRADAFLPIASRAGLLALHTYSTSDIVNAIEQLRRQDYR